MSNTFVQPTDITHAGDGSGRLFVVEQKGLIRILAGGSVSTFLDINARVRSNIEGGNEQRLLGLAFPHDYETSGAFYVNYTRQPDGASVVSRFRVSTNDVNAADPNSEEVLLIVPQFASNHNGGQLAFSPSNDYLYISLGDGGSGNDPQNNGQNPNTWLGAILRIDVSTPPGSNAYVIPRRTPSSIPTAPMKFGCMASETPGVSHSISSRVTCTLEMWVKAPGRKSTFSPRPAWGAKTTDGA